MTKLTGGYNGSNNVLTSTVNQQLVPQPIESTDIYGSPIFTSPYASRSLHGNRVYFSEFYFYNLTDCHVKINGSDSIYLKSNQNFEIDESNPAVWSFIVVDADVQFSWLGVYE